MLVTLVVLSVFPMAMAFAAASDLITMRISNRVSAVLVVGFVVAAVLTGLPLAEVGWHVAAAALVLAVTFGFFAAGWMGAATPSWRAPPRCGSAGARCSNTP